MNNLLSYLPFLASNEPQWWWLFLILGIFIVIVVVVIIVKRHVKVFQSEEKPKTDKEIAQEELDRLLQPIEEEKNEENDEQ